MSQADVGTGADDGRGTSPLRWWALGLSAIAIFSSYYESDAIGPIADLLGRRRGMTESTSAFVGFAATRLALLSQRRCARPTK